ncbi:unnamed protein product [Gadus morhua 'NCC']
MLASVRCIPVIAPGAEARSAADWWMKAVYPVDHYPAVPPDACELTLDPYTAFHLLSLSEDLKKVMWDGEDQRHQDQQKRFDHWPQVLGREALIGRCYWEVEREGVVEIGVTYRGLTRRGGGDDSRLGGNNKSWVLYCDDEAYSARVSPGGGGSSDTLTHLHTFWSSFTQEDLLPGFRGEPPGLKRRPSVEEPSAVREGPPGLKRRPSVEEPSAVREGPPGLKRRPSVGGAAPTAYAALGYRLATGHDCSVELVLHNVRTVRTPSPKRPPLI